jgi:hypothetical protein
MSMDDLYPWFVFAHILGAFIFAASHGVSTWLAAEIGGERDPVRIRALLALSGKSLLGLYVGVVVLLIGGVAAGISGGHFARLWIWLALGLLIAITVAMFAIASPYFGRLREAVGAPTRTSPEGTGTVTVTAPELEALVARNPAGILSAIGFIGFVAILWLMVFKPF